MKFFFTPFLFCLIATVSVAQFAPPAGQVGSTAIHKDSSIFVNWASHCLVKRGYLDISNPSLGFVTNGDSTAALGKPNAPNVVSLGDGGRATLTFPTPIVNGPGYDFAVFENAFVDTFLELAFVEVSSDGLNFHRFPATSNTQDTIQVGTFGKLDATKINNLAGKYIANYGTPFDLEELKNIAGLDINHITHVKIIDVVGCINEPLARFDKNNRKINDPWRTDFITGGFDLDAVGVINTRPTSITDFDNEEFDLKIYPNPSKNGGVNIEYFSTENTTAQFELFDLHGRKMVGSEHRISIGKNQFPMQFDNIAKGHYSLRITADSDYVISPVSFY